MQAPVSLSCHHCGNSFLKEGREVRRQNKKGRKHFYCSRACMGAAIGAANGNHDHRATAHLQPDNRRDQYSPFRYFMKKARGRKHETDLDLPFLVELWDRQNGRCALSGRLLELPPTTQAWEDRKRDPWKPSLDRIDSSKGYLKGNVRFVTVIANSAKQVWDDETVVEFCREVAAFHGT